MASHYVPCDDALDTLGYARSGYGPLERDSDQAWKVTRDRLLALPDDELVALALDGARGAVETFLAAALRRAIREDHPALAEVVDALYDAQEAEQDGEPA